MAETSTATPKPPRKSAAPKPPAVATSTDSTNGSAPKTNKSSVIDKAKETTSKLAGEAVTAARHAANEGKDRASEALTSVSRAVEGAANLVEEQVGPTYGKYARRAADQVSGLAETLQSKDIDDLVADTREFVRKQPIIAIGAAAAIGFALTRLIKIGGSGRNDV